jgi:hypothetical protein
MTDTLERWAFDDVQVRAAEVVDLAAETGNVTARLAAYEVEAQLDDGLFEVFTAGAFSRSFRSLEPEPDQVADQGHNRANGQESAGS